MFAQSHVFFYSLLCSTLFWDWNLFLLSFCFCMTSISPQRLFTWQRIQCPHYCVDGGRRLKAIIIHPAKHRGSCGSVKVSWEKVVLWVAAEHKSTSYRDVLKLHALWDRLCQKKQWDKDAAEFYIQTDTKATLTLFQRSSARPGSWLFTHASLFKLRQFTSSCPHLI